MVINGKGYQLKDITIKEVLKEFSLNEEKVVVEVNFQIIPKEQYANFILKENDSLEVISFVGGG